MPGADEITAIGNMDIFQLLIMSGIVIYFIWAKLVSRKNGKAGKAAPAMAPNGLAAIKGDISELKDWTKEHTEKYDKFVVDSKEKDAIQTEQIKEVTRRIGELEGHHGN